MKQETGRAAIASYADYRAAGRRLRRTCADAAGRPGWLTRRWVSPTRPAGL